MKTSKAFTWKQTLRWLPGVIISLVAIFFVLKLAQWEDLGPALQRFSWLHITAMVVFTLIFLGLRAVASRYMLNGVPRLSDAFWAINQGYLLNNIFPFRLGEFGRAVLLGQKTGLPAAQILSSIIIERALDIAIAASMMLATLPLALEMAWAKPVAILMLVIVVAALAGLYFMARNHDKVSTWIENLGSRWKWMGKWIAPQVRSLLSGMAPLTNPRRFLTVVGLILLSWLAAVFTYYISLLALAPSAPFWWGLFTDAVLALGIAIPSAPASLGTFEAAILGALSILGIDQTSALAYGITVHFIQIAVTGVLGLIGLVRQGGSISGIFRQLQERKSAA
ncbi:MAG TPA: lysylphosphatidylglycerol synthase transmembrane domain-containing protein [Bellilinea sp.]|nr:lysylphosphatidylglycerol synthase transmembrane domain-containing protein [Bellilinea sp.]